LFLAFGLGSWSSLAPKNAKINYCQIYGTIYFTEKASKADFISFEEEQENFANLVVYKESAPNRANEQGRWHITKDYGQADYIIYLTPNSAEADFTVAFTKTESFIGCNNNK
jgi:Family of unknown function (DUF6150)